MFVWFQVIFTFPSRSTSQTSTSRRKAICNCSRRCFLPGRSLSCHRVSMWKRSTCKILTRTTGARIQEAEAKHMPVTTKNTCMDPVYNVRTNREGNFSLFVNPYIVVLRFFLNKDIVTIDCGRMSLILAHILSILFFNYSSSIDILFNVIYFRALLNSSFYILENKLLGCFYWKMFEDHLKQWATPRDLMMKESISMYNLVNVAACNGIDKILLLVFCFGMGVYFLLYKLVWMITLNRRLVYQKDKLEYSDRISATELHSMVHNYRIILAVISVQPSSMVMSEWSFIYITI